MSRELRKIKETEVTKSMTARESCAGKPCVVIDFVNGGSCIVHADPGVVVFNHHDFGEVRLAKYVNLPIPDEWLEDDDWYQLDEVQYL